MTCGLMGEYGCVRCQTHHREWEPLYGEHLWFQSKHGVRLMNLYEAIVEAFAGAGPIDAPTHTGGPHRPPADP